MATPIGGILFVVVGVLWMLFCVGMLFFAGLELFSPAADGMSARGGR